ncbi:MAG TPA: xanthine dehydrogenase [Methylocystis sp.]|nr:xanthine dehydrogenase [Methylocystis sp.]
MARSQICDFFSEVEGRFVIVLGTNEIASAIAVRLALGGFSVVMSHDPFPPVIRRGMAFHDALFEEHIELRGVAGRKAETAVEVIYALAQNNTVAVTPLQLSDLIALRAPDVLIDARLQKSAVVPNLRKISGLSIGLGPNFTAGTNCDLAIETHPAATGQIIKSGATLAHDHMPRYLGGVGRERFIYSTRSGVWRTPLNIGARVFRNFVIGRLDGLPVPAPFDGFLRGVARDGSFVPQDVKIVELDPRGRDSSWTGCDERGAIIAEATIAAVALATRGKPRLPLSLTIQ